MDRKEIIEEIKGLVEKADSIVLKTIREYLMRAEIGYIKYGCTLDRTDLNHDDYLQHLKEELQDGVLYLNKYQEITKSI